MDHAKGFVYVHTLSCKRDGLDVCMYKVGRSLDPDQREAEWQHTCPRHRHQLVAKLQVRYQSRTGEFHAFFRGRVLIRGKEYWLHRELECYKFVVRCVDCGKNHREIFAIPGGKTRVVSYLKETTNEINAKLTDHFGL
jgi:hypothetical protein